MPMTDWIQVYSGDKFFPLEPTPGKIRVEDIAHPLSQQCRFAGHTEEFYSVAQHCLLVSLICQKFAHPSMSAYAALWGLMHDASEAYLVDIPAPLKRQEAFAGYMVAEKVLMDNLAQWAGLDTEMPEVVKWADKLALRLESDNFMKAPLENWTDHLPPHDFLAIRPFQPGEARGQFTKRFDLLTSTRNFVPLRYAEHADWIDLGAL